MGMARDDGMARIFFQRRISLLCHVQPQICFSLFDILAMAFEKHRSDRIGRI